MNEQNVFCTNVLLNSASVLEDFRTIADKALQNIDKKEYSYVDYVSEY